MALTMVACIVCGYDVYDGDGTDASRWLEEFRLIYSSPTGIAVSGVGAYTNPAGNRWIVPLAFDSRWSDMDAPPSDQMGVMHQGTINERYGYPVHDACWALAEMAFSPSQVPHAALFEVCESLPATPACNGLSWGPGHDYRGLLVADGGHSHPRGGRMRMRAASEPQVEAAKQNPFRVDELRLLVREQPQAPPFLPASVARASAAHDDCFGLLPVEIRLLIARHLCTSDAAKARVASRAFAFLFDDGQFWASRFFVSGDRAWVVEASEWSRHADSNNALPDWRWLYHRTNAANRSPGMQNRQRVWKLVQDMREVLSLSWMASPLPFEAWLVSDNLDWAEAAARTNANGPRNEAFDEGCRIFRKKKMTIPETIVELQVYLVRLGHDDYVAGLRFSSSWGQSLCLGYEAPRSQVIQLHGTPSGLGLAVGSRGIQGMQCVFDNGGRSPWIGCRPKEACTSWLVSPGRIVAVEAGFDACKMVSFSVAKVTGQGEGLEKQGLEKQGLEKRAGSGEGGNSG